MPLFRNRQKYTGCNLNTTELLDEALIGIYAVIKSNTVTVPNRTAYEKTTNNCNIHTGLEPKTSKRNGGEGETKVNDQVRPTAFSRRKICASSYVSTAVNGHY